MKYSLSKIFSKTLFPLFSISILFFSCNNKNNISSSVSTKAVETENKNEKLNITATFYPLYIMLLNITDGIENININLLAPADTGCLHDYQLTTKDMTAIQNADILVANGAGMEDFLEKALSTKKDKTIVAAEGYELVDNNAHIWVSPEGAIYEVQKIADELSTLDTNNSEKYKQNAKVYIEKLEKLALEMHEKLNVYEGRSIITFHEAFPYFADEFNLNLAAVIEREAGTSPSAKELQELIELVNTTNAKGQKCILFAEPQYSSEAASVIAKETGCKVYELDPAVTGKLDKDSYINVMKNNMNILLEAFKD